MNLELILHDDLVEAMVAGDTFDLLVDRIARMVRSGRPMAVAVRDLTNLQRPPEVYGGLYLDGMAGGGGVQVDRDAGSPRCDIALAGDFGFTVNVGFGADVHPGSGNATSAQAWKRYREHEADHPDFFRRRRDMTHIQICGGAPGTRYQIADFIVVNSWNGDGVRTEKVLAFAAAKGSW